jgi:hypothetical protein
MKNNSIRNPERVHVLSNKRFTQFTPILKYLNIVARKYLLPGSLPI